MWIEWESTYSAVKISISFCQGAKNVSRQTYSPSQEAGGFSGWKLASLGKKSAKTDSYGERSCTMARSKSCHSVVNSLLGEPPHPQRSQELFNATLPNKSGSP